VTQNDDDNDVIVTGILAIVHYTINWKTTD